MSKTVNTASFLHAPTPENVSMFDGCVNTSLREFVAEFCLATGTRADHVVEGGAGVTVLYPNGFIAGKLSVSHFTDAGKTQVVHHYSSNLISKGRKDRWSRSLSTRSSLNVKSLLVSLKKNGDMPEWDKQEAKLAAEIGGSFSYAMPRDHGKPRMDSLPADVATCAIEFALKKIPAVPYDMQKSMEVEYDKYLTKVKEHDCLRSVSARFRRGMRALGVATESTVDRPIYYYTEISFKDKAALTFDVPLQRYEDVAQIEAIHMDMIFAKTVFEKMGSSVDDPMCVPMTDKYYEDLDMGTGYCTGLRAARWLFIPKEST